MELVAGARKPSKPQAFEAMMGFEVREAHLDLLSLIARLEEGLRLHLATRHIASIFMEIARDLSRRRVGTALHLERTAITVEL